MVFAKNMFLNDWMTCSGGPMLLANRSGQLVIEIRAGKSGETWCFAGYRGSKRCERRYPDNKGDDPIVTEYHFAVEDLLEAMDDIVLCGTLYRIELSESGIRFVIRNDETGKIRYRRVVRLTKFAYPHPEGKPDAEALQRAAVQAKIVAEGPEWYDYQAQAHTPLSDRVPDRLYPGRVRVSS